MVADESEADDAYGLENARANDGVSLRRVAP